MRLTILSSVFLTLSSAFLLYALNNDTRALEEALQAQERVAAELKSDIAVLKAERAHLARPDRMEPAARLLGMAPPRPTQLTGKIETGSTKEHAGQ
ncbi:MAG: cell division protein FtsL [Hyphomicrobiaceae bacterium]|nr:cell division protein FtsL [Hyphomicrobiaceae bacterium]